jgi:hypothetical protein
MKRQAFTDGGWRSTLTEYFRPALNSAAQRTARKFTIHDMVKTAGTLEKFNTMMQETFPTTLRSATDGDFFTDINVLFDEAIAESDQVVKGFEDVEAAELSARAQEQITLQRKEEANSIKEISKALEEAGPDYATLKAIESGKVTFMVIPSGTNVSVPVPVGAEKK